MADGTDAGYPQMATDGVAAPLPSDTHSIPNLEGSAPMLDVHAPHEAISTWKSFFIHITTIVIGLLIAIALEQTVEYLHHREQRRQLIEDLRHEAEEYIKIIPGNNRAHLSEENVLRDILHAALAASPAGGSVAFVVPAHMDGPGDDKPEAAVWNAAKASGAVSVLSRSEIEIWERIDEYAKRADRNAEATNAAARALRAAEDHIGVSLKPGATIHVTLEQRDELTRALGNLIEEVHDLMLQDNRAAGASNAALHGAQTPEQMAPYIDEALKAMPQ